MEQMAGVMIVVWILGAVMAVGWLILPFALIGTKGLLRDLIFHTKQTNELLRAAAKRDSDAPPPPPAPTETTVHLL